MLPRLKSILEAFIKKTGCNSLFYIFSLKHFKKSPAMSFDRAQEVLRDLYPEPGGSCFTENLIEPEKNADLTIIIPVYNSERFIEECICSALNQDTNYTYQIKIINDGSTDRTGEILKRYEKNSRISIYTKQNGGAADARNYALKHITSRYVLFLDGDDVLCPNAVEVFLNAAYRYQAQIVQGGFEKFSGKHTVLRVIKNKFNNDEKDRCNVKGIPCAKIFDSTLFQNIQFPAGFWFEDTIVGFLLAYQAKRICLLNEVLYKWRIYPQSMTGKTREANAKSLDTIYVFRLILKEQNRCGVKTDHSIYEKALRQAVINGKRLFALPEQVRQAAFILLAETIKAEYPTEKTKQGYLFKEMEKALCNQEFHRYEALCKWM